jgi:hypothetical protein
MMGGNEEVQKFFEILLATDQKDLLQFGRDASFSEVFWMKDFFAKRIVRLQMLRAAMNST